ncbi:MAG: hypothetical protein U0P45_06150 [Acidimicrobiales bacterium]
MIRKMLIGAAALLVLLAAPAAAQYDLIVGPGTVEPGGTVTVSGGSCAFNGPVVIRVTQKTATKAPGDIIFETTVIADDKGNFSLTFEMPADAEAGVYVVAAYCGGTQVAAQEIEVGSGGGTATTQANNGGGTIVRTGSDLNGLGLLGAGLLTLGGIILIATKTRRHEARA